ncbi:MAG: leucine-rich repeat domain-containing protein [Clostridia bacterium]|nr:leucine-rich repeat domain-containing protein [Clostridia bacterium]
MKKIIALFLVVGMTAVLFASCKKNPDSTDTSTSASTTESTSGNTSTSETTTETTTKGPVVFVDPQIIDSLYYDYIIRTVKDQDTNKVVGVAIFNWKQEKAKSELVFDSEYTMQDGTKLPVLQIGVGQGILSFQNELKSITVPASVDKIAKKAFAFCSELKTVNLSEGLESIGEMAFWSCKSLESISIPSTVTEIGTNAFAGCENLRSVTLPRAFESQIDNIFEGCPSDMVITYID